MCQPLPVDTHMAIALVKLITPASLCYIAHLCRVGKVTDGEAILEVNGTLQDVMANTVLQATDSLEVVADSKRLSSPSVFGPSTGHTFPSPTHPWQTTSTTTRGYSTPLCCSLW